MSNAYAFSAETHNLPHILIGATGDSWQKKVVKPCVDIVKRFLSDDSTVLPSTSASDGVVASVRAAPPSRELWTQYVCEVRLVFRELYCMHTKADAENPVAELLMMKHARVILNAVFNFDSTGLRQPGAARCARVGAAQARAMPPEASAAPEAEELEPEATAIPTVARLQLME